MRSVYANYWLRKYPHKRLSLGSFLVMGLLAIFLFYKFGLLKGKSNWEESLFFASVVENKWEQIEKENRELKQKIIALERDYQIQLEAKKSLSVYLKQLQNQNSELSRDMALYQTISGRRSLVNQSLEIKAFQVFCTENRHIFRYLIVLSKQSLQMKYAQGVVRMTILGKVGKKSVQLPVKYIDSARKDGLAFRFKHLQELTGELSFPIGFVPDGVLFQVEPDREWPHFQQQFPWVTDMTLDIVETSSTSVI